MPHIHLAPDLKLPYEVVTQTLCILAKKRVGKTYTASVMAEEMVKAKLPFVALDPTGAWWGLRAHEDGKREGLPVTILGGEHGDVPLEPTGGKVVADLVVDHPGFYIVDLSQFVSGGDQDRFAMEFGERLFRRKAKHREPLHLFVDEADMFAPQKPFPGQQRMLGAYEALVRRGGILGIGVTLISQRPAILNKNVLTQSETLIALRTTGPQDQAAILQWVRQHGSDEDVKTFMQSLAGLKNGEAWIWSPSWLEIFKRVKIRKRTTFNSSATPKVGEKRIEPQALAKIDLAAVKKRMTDTIERAKSTDPKELQKKITVLEQELLQANKVQPTPKIVEVPVVITKDLKALERAMDTAKTILSKMEMQLDKAKSLQVPIPSPSLPRQPALLSSPPPHRQSAQSKTEAISAEGGQPLKAMPRAILTALAQHPEGLSKAQVLIYAGYRSSGPISVTFAEFVRDGKVESNGNRLTITGKGLEALGPFEPLPTGSALLASLLNGSKLKAVEKAMLQVIAEAFPAPITKQAILQKAGYASSGPVSVAFAKFVRLNWVRKAGQRELVASEIFFD